MKNSLKVAAIQAEVPFSWQKGEEQVRRLVEKAASKPVDLVGLPEDCVAPKEDIEKGYKPLEFLSSVAKNNSIYLFGANLVKEKNGDLYNIGFLFDRKGKLLLKHRKVVLTPLSTTKPGKNLEVVKTEFGILSLLICKDAFHKYAAWFFDKLRRAGVELVLVPSLSINVSNSKYDIDLWVDSLKALSKWFYMAIVAPGTVGGNTSSFSSFGHALIIGAAGKIAEGSGNKEEILRMTLNLNLLRDSRKKYESEWEPKDVPKTRIKVKMEAKK